MGFPWKRAGLRRCLPVYKFLSSYFPASWHFRVENSRSLRFLKLWWDKRNTSLAVYTVAFVTYHLFGFTIVGMYAIGALLLADTAGNAAVFISDHFKLRVDKFNAHNKTPSFTVTITGSPPAGAQIFSASGSMARMAVSSLAI